MRGSKLRQGFINLGRCWYRVVDPERAAGLVSPEHLERCPGSNTVPADCESDEITTTLSRPTTDVHGKSLATLTYHFRSVFPYNQADNYNFRSRGCRENRADINKSTNSWVRNFQPDTWYHISHQSSQVRMCIYPWPGHMSRCRGNCRLSDSRHHTAQVGKLKYIYTYIYIYIYIYRRMYHVVDSCKCRLWHHAENSR